MIGSGLSAPLDTCVVKSLKVVHVKGFKGTLHELCLLGRLIIYGKVLQHMYVTVSKEEDGNGGNENLYRARARDAGIPKSLLNSADINQLNHNKYYGQHYRTFDMVYYDLCI